MTSTSSSLTPNEQYLSDKLVEANKRINDLVHDVERERNRASAYREEMWAGPRCCVCEPDLAHAEGGWAETGKEWVCWGCFTSVSDAQDTLVGDFEEWDDMYDATPCRALARPAEPGPWDDFWKKSYPVSDIAALLEKQDVVR